MILQTIQPLCVWHELEKKGVAFSQPNYEEHGGLDTSWNFKTSYDWMKSQMLKRGIAPTNNEKDLFWAWAWSGDRGKKKVDLRTRIHSINTPHVLLTIEKKESDVLLSSFELWHYVLNYWPIIVSKEDEEKWDNLCKNEVFNYYKNKPLEGFMHKKIEKSWSLALQLKEQDDKFYLNEDIASYLGGNEEIVQATFWNIKLQEVREVQKIKLPKEPMVYSN